MSGDSNLNLRIVLMGIALWTVYMLFTKYLIDSTEDLLTKIGLVILTICINIGCIMLSLMEEDNSNVGSDGEEIEW